MYLDITYNYDEHWLIHTVLPGPGRRAEAASSGSGTRATSGCGRLVQGARRRPHRATKLLATSTPTTPSGGRFPASSGGGSSTGWTARALLAIFALIGGVYMTFVGGEVELEEDLRMTHLRAAVPEIRLGRVDYDSVRADHDAIFAVAREREGQVSFGVVNFSRLTSARWFRSIPNPYRRRHTGRRRRKRRWSEYRRVHLVRRAGGFLRGRVRAIPGARAHDPTGGLGAAETGHAFTPCPAIRNRTCSTGQIVNASPSPALESTRRLVCRAFLQTGTAAITET